MEKGWRKRHDVAKDAIINGYRRGVCNKDGESIKNENGRFIAKPRIIRHIGSVADSESEDTFLELYRRGAINVH